VIGHQDSFLFEKPICKTSYKKFDRYTKNPPRVSNMVLKMNTSKKRKKKKREYFFRKLNKSKFKLKPFKEYLEFGLFEYRRIASCSEMDNHCRKLKTHNRKNKKHKNTTISKAKKLKLVKD
jgi:hypothetical protein